MERGFGHFPANFGKSFDLQSGSSVSEQQVIYSQGQYMPATSCVLFSDWPTLIQSPEIFFFFSEVLSFLCTVYEQLPRWVQSVVPG